MIVVETNSCPSGQKSMPILLDSEEQGGYRVVIENAFGNLLEDADLNLGGLAVIYDKNPMEATGYAAVMADVMKEKVWVAEFYDDDPDPPVKWVDKVLFVRDEAKGTHHELAIRQPISIHANGLQSGIQYALAFAM